MRGCRVPAQGRPDRTMRLSALEVAWSAEPARFRLGAGPSRDWEAWAVYCREFLRPFAFGRGRQADEHSEDDAALGLHIPQRGEWPVHVSMPKNSGKVAAHASSWASDKMPGRRFVKGRRQVWPARCPLLNLVEKGAVLGGVRLEGCKCVCTLERPDWWRGRRQYSGATCSCCWGGSELSSRCSSLGIPAGIPVRSSSSVLWAWSLWTSERVGKLGLVDDLLLQLHNASACQCGWRRHGWTR